jgi:arylsulfatase A-like enzyme
MDRRLFLKSATLTTGLVVGEICYGLQITAKTQNKRLKPNIIWIISDDQGIADAEIYPHKSAIHTPNLRRLARKGVMFTEGYANCFSCAPSRAAIMLGDYQQSIGVYNNEDTLPGIAENIKIAPEYFKELGYKTGLIGKWHLGGRLNPETAPLKKGFDRAWYWYGATHDYWNPNVGHKFQGGGRGYCPIFDQGEEIEKMDYLTDEITKHACNFIDENNAVPFFLCVTHHCAHVPLQVPEDLYRKYEKLGYGRKAAIARGMYEVLDKGIGAILDKLEEYGISNETLIIFASDNGGAVPSGPLTWPYQAGKFTHLEGGLRVPFIISWPGHIPENRTYGYPVMHMDILPTSLNAVSPYTFEGDGVNLLPYLLGQKNERPHEKMFWCIDPGDSSFAVRVGDWKLMRTGIAEGLFNLAEDPTEKYDISAKYPEKVRELIKIYNRWKADKPPKLLKDEDRQRAKRISDQLEKEHPGLSESPTFGFKNQQEL